MARHATVAAGALVGPVLALAGVLGGGSHPERFDAKQVLITPAGADGVRVREVVDQDFGTVADRHGYERLIPNDFGVPIDVEASSPDAPDSLSVDSFGFETRIRVGDADTVVEGQHRYVLSYTLPDARISQGELAVDVIGNLEELETGRMEVVISGFDLAQARCNVGGFGDSGGCSFERDGEVYRAVIDGLAAGQGITVGGPITALTEPADVAMPPIPDRRADRRGVLALTMLPLGLAAAVGTHAMARRAGRNEVGAGGAADAAAGDVTGGVQLVPDSKMDELATIEFVPPKGLRPWQAAILLNERVDDVTIGAVISDLIAAEVLDARAADDGVELVRGPKFGSVAPEDQARADRLLGGDGVLRLGAYSRSLEQEWSAIGEAQRAAASGSGWWAKNAPGGHGYSYPRLLTTVIAALIALVAAGALFGLLRSWPIAIVLAVLIPATVAYVRYRPLLPVLSAAGSARLLQTESFRRFLDASEGKHVEWAYKNGMLREYSAWAVALGAANAWQRALAQAALPPPAMAQAAPMILYTHAPMFQSTHTRPAPTGSGGGGFGGGGGGFGGGFSSGGVGGGGGGGSSGSW
jgi:uncharacterized membrane protein YgcG